MKWQLRDENCKRIFEIQRCPHLLLRCELSAACRTVWLAENQAGLVHVASLSGIVLSHVVEAPKSRRSPPVGQVCLVPMASGTPSPALTKPHCEKGGGQSSCTGCTPTSEVHQIFWRCFAKGAWTTRLKQRREGTFTKWAAIDFRMFIGIREGKDLFNHLVSIIRAELFPTGHLLVVCQL